MKLKYYRKGDYPFPNLATESSGNLIGKYGMQRKSFLRAHKSGWYQSMLLTGKLDRHLAEVEKLAKERMDVLMAGLLQKYPVPDQEADPFACVEIHKKWIILTFQKLHNTANGILQFADCFQCKI